MIGRNTGLYRRDFLKGAAGGAAGLLGARAGVTRAQDATPAAAGSGRTIRVLVVGDPFQFALEKVLGQFTEQTGINVEMENLAYDQLNARLATSFVSGTPDADVITVDQMWNGTYSDSGWIIPLDDFIAGDADVDIQDFIPEVLYSLNTWRGQVVTLPIAAYGQGVVYRQDVFEANGLDAPPTDAADAAGWTWDRYREIAEGLNGTDFEGTSMFGTVVCGAQPVPIVHMYTQLAASFGARWFESFPATTPWDFAPTINSAENTEALGFYKSLYDLSPPEAINYVWFDAGTRFSQGDIGLFYWWTPYFYLTKSDGYMTGTPSVVQDTLGYGVLPKVSDDAEQTVSLGGWSLGIPSTSAQPGRGVAVRQVGDGRRSPEADGAGAGLQLFVQRLLPRFALQRSGAAGDLPVPRHATADHAAGQRQGGAPAGARLHDAGRGLRAAAQPGAERGDVGGGCAGPDRDAVAEHPGRSAAGPVLRRKLRGHGGEHAGADGPAGVRRLMRRRRSVSC